MNRLHKKKAVVATVFFLIPFYISCWVYAQSVKKVSLADKKYITQYSTHYYGADEGLLAASITGIAQDNNGFLWITSRSGLYRFDGLHFKEFGMKDFKHLNTNYFVGIQSDADGRIWIATLQNGLISYKDFNFYGIDSASLQVFKHNILSIFATKSGVLIGTEKAGLHLYRNGIYKKIETSPEISEASITTICQDKLGMIWIAVAGKGIYRLKITNSDNYRLDKSYLDNELHNVYHLLQDDNTTMLAGTASGLFRLESRNIMLIQQTKDIEIRHIYFDSSQRAYWFATPQGIAQMKSNQGLVWLTSENGLRFKGCRYLFFDREQTLWGASDDVKGELVQLISGKFAVFSTAEGLSSSYINAVVILKKDCVLITTNEKNINLITPDEIKKIPFSEKVSSIIQHGNQFYIAADILHKSNAELKITEKYPQISQPYYLFKDSKHILWIANSSFLFNIIGDENAQVVADLSGIHVHAIAEEKNGNLLLGTSKGLFKLDVKNKLLVKQSLVADRVVYGIYTEKNGKLFLATEHGIVVLQDSNASFFQVANGLPTDVVYDIAEDKNGKIWIATAKGIAMTDNSFFDDNNVENCRLFDVRDGLRTTFFASPIRFQADTTGMLWISTENGLYVIQTQNIPLNQEKPFISIYGFIADKQPLEVVSSSKISVPPGVNRFEIDYAVVSLLNPSKVRIKYKLEGFDTEWREVDTERKAIYTNLPSGNFIFKIIAGNSDGIWDENGKAISFHYQPFFYKTTLFYTIIGFLVVIASIYVFRSKLQTHKKRSEDLMRIVVKRTGEIANQKKQIEKQKNEIALQKDEIEHAYSTISTVSKIGQKVTSTLNLDELIITVYTNLNSLMPTEVFGIGFLNETKEYIEFKNYLVRGERTANHLEYMNKPYHLSVQCIQEAKPIFINDSEKEYKELASFLAEQSKHPAAYTRSVLYAPLLVENEPIGVITVQSFDENAYETNDLTILQALASYVSVAYLNSKTYLVIEEKNQNITDSLRYAQTIQQALLPTREELEHAFNDHFVIFLPKDIVSGDFYWFTQVDNIKYIAAIDCTGHGVPGAFMSMIGNEFLNEIINADKIYSPAAILEKLHENIRRALRQEEAKNTDGMDICLCKIESISLGHRKITFAGARRPLYYTQGEELKEEKGEKNSIGGIQREEIRTFTNKEIILAKGEMLYLFTDGIIDQSNVAGKRYGSVKFFELLDQIKSIGMREQKALILASLATHQSMAAQRDDITIVGIKI